MLLLHSDAKWLFCHRGLWHGRNKTTITWHLYVDDTNSATSENIKTFRKNLTDENICLIAEHLKNLTSVEFTDGNYTPEGIKSLSGHPSIEKLNLFEFISRPSISWLLTVYDVLLSLPKIAHVKLIGYEMSKTLFFAKNLPTGIPQMPTHIQVDVRNYPFEDMVWWICGNTVIFTFIYI